MNKNLEKMIDEFTNNYSELLVEVFYIKYINDFDLIILIKPLKNYIKN